MDRPWVTRVCHGPHEVDLAKLRQGGALGHGQLFPGVACPAVLDLGDAYPFRIDDNDASDLVYTYLHLLRSPDLGGMQEEVGLLEVRSQEDNSGRAPVAFAFVVFGPFGSIGVPACPDPGYLTAEAYKRGRKPATLASAPDKARLRAMLVPKAGAVIPPDEADTDLVVFGSAAGGRPKKAVTTCQWGSRGETTLFIAKLHDHKLELDIALCRDREGVRHACQVVMMVALLAAQNPEAADASGYLRAKPSFGRTAPNPSFNRNKGCSLVNLYDSWGFVECSAVSLNVYRPSAAETGIAAPGVAETIESGLRHFVAVLRACYGQPFQVHRDGDLWQVDIEDDKRNVAVCSVTFSQLIPTVCVTRACEDLGVSEQVQLMDAFLQGPLRRIFAPRTADARSRPDPIDQRLAGLVASDETKSGYRFFGKDMAHADGSDLDIEQRHPWYARNRRWQFRAEDGALRDVDQVLGSGFPLPGRAQASTAGISEQVRREIAAQGSVVEAGESTLVRLYREFAADCRRLALRLVGRAEAKEATEAANAADRRRAVVETFANKPLGGWGALLGPDKNETDDMDEGGPEEADADAEDAEDDSPVPPPSGGKKRPPESDEDSEDEVAYKHKRRNVDPGPPTSPADLDALLDSFLL